MTTTDTPQSQVELSDAAKVLRLRVALRECVRLLRLRQVHDRHFIMKLALETLEETKITTTYEMERRSSI